jgi:hypothetical protein
MSPLFIYSGLAYWGLCAALFFGSLLLDCPDESLKQKGDLLKHISSPRREFSVALSAILALLAAPLLTPYLIVNLLLDHRRQASVWRSIMRSYHEKIYEKIHPVNLPQIARKYFDEQAPALLDLGFQEIGRYLLKPEPAPSYGHVFQSPDGRSLGVLGQMFDNTYFSFSTLFANGLALETASIEETPKLARVNESTTFRVVFYPAMSIAEAYVHHELEIAALESEMRTRALAYQPAQFRDILTYEDRVYHQWLFDQGEQDAPPPPAVLPMPITDPFSSDTDTEAFESEAWHPSTTAT